MGRVIKFRAWNTRHKYMDDDFFIHSENGSTWDKPLVSHDTPNKEIAPSGELVIMQFTGIYDANGVEIYESDLVTVPGIGIAEIKICQCYGVAYKAKGNNGFYEVPYIDCAAENDYPTIIGNIHQHPELLGPK